MKYTPSSANGPCTELQWVCDTAPGMRSARSSHKRIDIEERCCPITEPGILELVLSFLACEGVYVKTVCKEWSRGYDKLMTELAGKPRAKCNHAHSSSCTTISAAFTSAARVRLAGLWGFNFGRPHTNGRLRRCAGRVGDVEALQAAHKLGLPYSHDVVCGAAESGCLDKLKWLYKEQSWTLLPMPHSIAAWAAAGGSIEMLRWLKETGVTFTHSTSYKQQEELTTCMCCSTC
jgi:hypothetical protein